MSPRGTKSRTDAMELSQLDLTTLELPGPHSACPLALLNGTTCEFFLHKEEWFRAPFGASHFNNPEATRLSLEFDVSQSTALPAMQALDEAIIAAAIRQKLFGSKSEQEVRESYHSQPGRLGAQVQPAALPHEIQHAGVRALLLLEVPGAHALEPRGRPEDRAPAPSPPAQVLLVRERQVGHVSGLLEHPGQDR